MLNLNIFCTKMTCKAQTWPCVFLYWADRDTDFVTTSPSANVTSSSFFFAFLFFSECHEWFAAPISAYFCHGSSGCFCSECCTGGEPTAVPPVKRFLEFTPATAITTLDRPQVPFFKSSVWHGRESISAYQLWWLVLNQMRTWSHTSTLHIPRRNRTLALLCRIFWANHVTPTALHM